MRKVIKVFIRKKNLIKKWKAGRPEDTRYFNAEVKARKFALSIGGTYAEAFISKKLNSEGQANIFGIVGLVYLVLMMVVLLVIF